MKIIKAKDYDQMSRKAANIISAQVIMKPDCVLVWQPEAARLALTVS